MKSCLCAPNDLRFRAKNLRRALKIVKRVILITDTLSLNVVISPAGEFEGAPQYLTDAAGAIIFRSGGVVFLRCIRKTRVPAVSSSCERFLDPIDGRMTSVLQLDPVGRSATMRGGRLH